MALAAKGLPAGGPQGYEILDGLSGFGTTSQMFDAAYWRAKEGELARTITGSPDVRAARVHLANPVAQPFARTPAGSASVTVTMARGELSREQAEAIRYLVSSAVAGIPHDAVAVIDSARGVVLAGKDDPLAIRGARPNERAERLRANIERLLEARVGAGKAIVEVNVDADMDSQTITERTIDPESRVAISSETEATSENATGSTPGRDGGEQPAGRRRRRRLRREQAQRHHQPRAPELRGLRDHARAGDPARAGAPDQRRGDGRRHRAGRRRRQGAWAPRPAEEMETLRLLVQSAMGFDEARGDTVTIESLQFTVAAGAGRRWRRPAATASSTPGAAGSPSSASSARSCWR